MFITNNPVKQHHIPEEQTSDYIPNILFYAVCNSPSQQQQLRGKLIKDLKKE
jgi:hypothetical protein